MKAGSRRLTPVQSWKTPPLSLPCPLQDYALPQVQCALQADPISLSLTQQIAQLLADALALPPGEEPPPAADAAAPEPRAASACGAAGELSATPAGGGSPTGVVGCIVPGDGSRGAGSSVPVLMLDLQLSSVDLQFAADSGGPGAPAPMEARLACAGATLTLHSMLDGLAVEVRMACLTCCLETMPPSPVRCMHVSVCWSWLLILHFMLTASE